MPSEEDENDDEEKEEDDESDPFALAVLIQRSAICSGSADDNAEQTEDNYKR